VLGYFLASLVGWKVRYKKNSKNFVLGAIKEEESQIIPKAHNVGYENISK